MQLIRLKTAAIIALLISLMACEENQADLLIHNGVISTVNEHMEVVEAMAVKDGKIIAVGNSKTLLEKYAASESIDLQGKAVYPGFIDPHCHFLGYGRSLYHANLVGTSAFEEVLDIIKEHHEKYPSEWLIGRGWDQNDWKVKEFPNRDQLDELFPNTPVYLTRIDGHAVLVNQKALDLIGIDDDFDFNPNLLQKENGKLTGILIDEAMDINAPYLPEGDENFDRAALMSAQENCFAVGLTSVMDCGLPRKSIELIHQLQLEGELHMSVSAMVSGSDEASMKYFLDHGPLVTDKLNVRSMKFYADGALGSRGACLLKPYHDDPGNYGAIIENRNYFKEQYDKLIASEFQVCTHAIGDSANRMVLELYADVLQGVNDKRWRIEHAQVVHPDDFHYFRDNSIIPSVQSTHATSDMYWAGDRLGEERLRSAYAYQDLLKQLGIIANGSDFPVENINPLYGFYAAVARKDLSGYPSGGFQYENALSRKDALRAMTIWAAYANFDEERRGSLEVGKHADFVVLDQDILEIKLSDVPKVKVMSTYVDGIQRN